MAGIDDISEFIGWVIGLPAGNSIQEIKEGYATFIGSLVLMFGWLVSRRWELRKHQIEQAHNYLIIQNKKIASHAKYLFPYMSQRRSFPVYQELLKPKNKPLYKSVSASLNELEILSIDISHGLANESYAIETERGLLCNFFILSRDFIESVRVAREQQSFMKSYERQFVRIYIKRWSIVELVLEFFLGRPVSRYSYFMFTLRYAVFSQLYGLNTDFSLENWPVIRDRSRDFRHLMGILVAVGFMIFSLWVYREKYGLH